MLKSRGMLRDSRGIRRSFLPVLHALQTTRDPEGFLSQHMLHGCVWCWHAGTRRAYIPMEYVI